MVIVERWITLCAILCEKSADKKVAVKFVPDNEGNLFRVQHTSYVRRRT